MAVTSHSDVHVQVNVYLNLPIFPAGVGWSLPSLNQVIGHFGNPYLLIIICVFD